MFTLVLNQRVFALERLMDMYLACVVPAKQTVDKSSRDADAQVQMHSVTLKVQMHSVTLQLQMHSIILQAQMHSITLGVQMHSITLQQVQMHSVTLQPCIALVLMPQMTRHILLC